jgi:hypothetical protein
MYRVAWGATGLGDWIWEIESGRPFGMSEGVWRELLRSECLSREELLDEECFDELVLEEECLLEDFS